jgi:hypothetical protein
MDPLDKLTKITTEYFRKRFIENTLEILDPPNCPKCGTKQKSMWMLLNDWIIYCPKCLYGDKDES